MFSPSSYRSVCRAILSAASISIFGLAPQSPSATITSTWTAGSGIWGNAANWSNSPAVLIFPNNAGSTTYDAILGNGGTITLEQSITIDSFTQSSGTLTGGGTLALTVGGSWTGGTLGGSGTTTIASGATLGISGFGNKVLGDGGAVSRTLVNNGTVNLTGSDLFLGTGGVGFPAGGTFTNNGTFDAAGGAGIASFSNGGGPLGVFSNSAGASFTKSGTGTANIGVPFNNSGTINVSGGTLSFGTAPTFNAGTQLTGPGTILLPSGATINGLAPIGAGLTLNLSGGTFVGTTTFAGAGTFNWTGGTLGGSGTTTIASGATLGISGFGNKVLGDGGAVSRTLVNNGTVNLTGSDLFLGTGGVGFPAGGTFTNNGTFDAAGGAGIASFSNGGGPLGVFSNSAGASFTKSGTGTANIGVPFNNSGTINVSGGTLSFGTAPTFNAGTQLTGPGTILLPSGATINGLAPIGAGLTLNLSGGTFVGTTTFAGAGTFNWTGGTLGGSGTTTIASGATLGISGFGNKVLGDGGAVSRTLVNNGTVNLTGSDLFLGTGGVGFPAGGTFTNNGTFDAAGGAGIASFSNGGGPLGVFSNSAGASFTKSGTGTANIGVPFNNSGTINVSGGTLSFGTAPTFNAGTQLTGPGTILLPSGATINGLAPIGAGLTLNLSGGTFVGTTTFAGAGTFNWTGGTLGGSGTTTIASGATLGISGFGNKVLGDGGAVSRTLVNNGTVNLTGSDLFLGTGGVGFPAGGTFTNNGTFDAAGGAGIASFSNGGGPLGVFSNSAGASFTKSGTGTANIGVPFNNSGTINVSGGTLSFGTAPTFNAGTQLTGPGTILLPSGATINGLAPIGAGLTLNLSGGTFVGTTTFAGAGTFNWTGGTLGGSGTTTIASGATLNLSSANVKFLGDGNNAGRTLINNGTTNLSGSGGNAGLWIANSGSPSVAGSTFTNNGVFNVTDGANIVFNNVGGLGGTFTNSAGASFNKSGVGTTTVMSVPLTNAGTINVNSGTLNLSGGLSQTAGLTSLGGGSLAGSTLTFNGGTLRGTGNVTGSVVFNAGATLEPGLGAVSGQTLTAQNNVVFNAGSLFRPDFFNGGSADRLNVLGNATFNGTLTLGLPAGFVPDWNSTFRIADVGGTRTGTFGLTEGQSVGYGLRITFLAGNGNDVELSSGVAPGAVPIAGNSSTQPVFVAGSYATTNTGLTYTFPSLDVVPGATATLGPNDTLVLTNGPLVVAPGAVFTGNGLIVGNVVNHGLVRIPIVRMDAVSLFTGPGLIEVPRPEPAPVPAPTPPVVINPGTTVSFGGGTGGGVGGGGSFAIGGGATNEGGIILPAPRPIPGPNPGDPVRYDASLEITGTYTQTETGKLRLFIGGDIRGETYSTLIVGEEVTLDGEIELVLQPDLFGFLPVFGDTFDLIESPLGITIAGGLTLSDFVTQAGASYVPNLTLSPYDSGILNDPDDLFSIGEDLFRLDLVEGDTILRATFIGPVPEASNVFFALVGAVPLLRRRRRGW